MSQIETLNVDCRELEQKQKSSEEKIIFLESENGHSAKKIEELKAILVAKQSEMEDKQIALEEEKRRLEAEVRLRLNSKQLNKAMTCVIVPQLKLHMLSVP